MKKTLLLLVALITATIAFAKTEIDGIYYKLNDETKTAEVTYQYFLDEDNYSGITTISIPEKVTYNSTEYSVTSIGSRAFASCPSLTSITIPNSVTSIGSSAFSSCSSLTSINVDSNHPNYTSIDGVLYNKDITTLICCSGGKTSITIPNSVTSIGNDAFYDCSSLTSITIPNSVTSIGDEAFSNCSSLTSITIPNSVTSIGEYAFLYTPWLNNQPNGCLYIGKCLYQYRGEMPANTHINVSEGTTMICDYAFSDCSSLKSISIPNSVTSIGSYAFYDCSSLTSITIPNSVTSIGEHAFLDTPWLNNQPDGCVYINSLLYGYKGEMPENTHIDVKEGTTIICDYAFLYCSSLTSITIPNSVTSIGNDAFYSCDALKSITIPNSVTSIEYDAFQYCYSLTSIIIGNSVTSIGDYAFNSCYALTSITCLSSTPPEASNLGAPTSTCTLIVPKAAYNSYLRHTYWGQFLNIETIDVDYKKLTAIANNTEWGVVEGGGYYDNGDEATLTATANSGYRFVKWSDEVTDNPRTVVVTQDSTFTAIFEANSFAISTSVIDDAMGFVTEGGEYAYGTEITLTATANKGYRFTQWSDGNTDNPRIITVTENKTYTAEFEVQTYTITTAAAVPSMGGVEVILNAKPIEGFEFVEWTDGNTDNPRILTLTENIEVYARFQIAQGGTPVDLETSKISSANIYTTNGTLHVENATENYHILDAAGRLIYSGNASTIQLPRGIYLITMGGEVEKIVL